MLRQTGKKYIHHAYMEKGRKSLRVALYLTFQKLALIVKPQMLRYKLLSRGSFLYHKTNFYEDDF